MAALKQCVVFLVLYLSLAKPVQVRISSQLRTCVEETNCSCASLDLSDLDDLARQTLHNGIQAVKYWPEPVGYESAVLQKDRDLYTDTYANFHARDLPAIQQELGANVLLLGPWSFASHRKFEVASRHVGFLQTASMHNMSVIPSFDLRAYWQNGAWSTPTTREQLRRDFLSFLQDPAVYEGERLATPGMILMWNLVGLPAMETMLPRECVGQLATDVGNFENCIAADMQYALLSVQEIQQILWVVRETQQEFYCTGDADCQAGDDAVGVFKFDRPVAITLEISSDESELYFKAFLLWMERVVGCNHIAAGHVRVPKSFVDLAQCAFNGYGLYDSFIFKVHTVADKLEATAIRGLREFFGQPQQLLGSAPVSVADLAGSTKLVLLEYGFPAFSHGVMQIEKQQAALREVWHGQNSDGWLHAARSNASCVAGVVVDEWLDVWSADEVYPSCAHLKLKFGHSACGPLTKSGVLAVAYQGLVGQFHASGQHCIEKRYVNRTSRFWFADGLIQEEAHIAHSPCAMVRIRPGLPFAILAGALLPWFLVKLWALFRPICRREYHGDQQVVEKMEDDNYLDSLVKLLEVDKWRMLREFSSEAYGSSLAEFVAAKLQDGYTVRAGTSHLTDCGGWGFSLERPCSICPCSGVPQISYHRILRDGRGRGPAVRTFAKRDDFVRWLARQSDRTMAIFGLTDEDLRQNRIGLGTITRKDFYHLMELTGFADPDRLLPGSLGKTVVEHTVDFNVSHGKTCKLSVELDISGVATPHFMMSVTNKWNNDSARCLDMQEFEQELCRGARACAETFFSILLSSHLAVQADCLMRQIDHELLVVGDATQARINISQRVLEGYHELYPGEKMRFHDYEDEEMAVAQAILFRLVLSMSEHLAHAPEWMAFVLYQIVHDQGRFRENSPPGATMRMFTYTVRYKDLLNDPLEHFCYNSNISAPNQGINFDDVNDCARLYKYNEPGKIGRVGRCGRTPNKSYKTWREPAGLWAVASFIINYRWVLTVVVWLLWSAVVFSDSQLFEFWLGSTTRGPRMLGFPFFSLAVVDLGWLCVLMTCHILVQSPLEFPTNRLTGYLCCRTPRANRCRLRFCCCFKLPSLLVLSAVAVALCWMFGSASELGDQDYLFNQDYLALLYLVCRCLWGFLCSYTWDFQFSYVCAGCSAAMAMWKTMRSSFSSALIWTTFWCLLFLVNTLLLVERVRHLTPYQFCNWGDAESDFCSTFTAELLWAQVHIPDTRCFACCTALVASWTVTVLSSVIAMYFVFNVFVGILGTVIGGKRGVVEAPIDRVDFRRQAEHEFQHKSLRVKEVATMNHRSLLKAVFGNCWEAVWTATVDGLHEDCLIDKEMTQKLRARADSLVDISGPGVLDCARARLGFFFSSLRSILNSSDINFQPRRKDGVFVGSHEMEHVHIPSLTQIIPVFAEDGLRSVDELLSPGEGETSTRLEFLISQFPEEWKIFALKHKHHPTKLYELLSQNFRVGGRARQDIFDAVREWASDRTQTVIRTVNGAVHYHRALKVLLDVRAGEERIDLRKHVQLILAHQTYGRWEGQIEKDVHYILRKHRDYPVFVCIDFERGRTRPKIEEMVDRHLEGLRFAKENTYLRYASVLIKYDQNAKEEDSWPIQIVHVLPRTRGLMIGSGKSKSQGRAGNQLGALRFIESHFVQMMDANMGAFAGEAFKVPFVLHGFYGSENDGARDKLRARIISSRRHIFTQEHGLVGSIMADAEWTFATITQRVLQLLKVRIHHARPFFMDGFWALGRGSVSKASPHINLSDDIFEGMNVKIRNEESIHTDILEWEKGMEVQFISSSGYFHKLASGSVGLIRSRDLWALSRRASPMGAFALYFATAARYIHMALVDICLEIFIFMFLYLTLAAKTLEDVGDLGSILAAEWLLTPAFGEILPAIIGIGFEHGPKMLKNYLLSSPAAMVYFMFVNKMMSHSVHQTFRHTDAQYVNTGRPLANKAYTLAQAFQLYWSSHYKPALRVLYYVLIYRAMNHGGALPLLLVTSTVLVWILAPVLFQPPTTKTLLGQVLELSAFIQSNLREVEVQKELKLAERGLILPLIISLAFAFLDLAIVPSDVLDQIWAPLYAMLMLFILRSVLAAAGLKFVGLTTFFLPCLALIGTLLGTLVLENRHLASMLIATMVLLHILTFSKLLLWSLAAALFSAWHRVANLAMLRRRDRALYHALVRHTFDFSFLYEIYVFGALVVLILQVAFAALLKLLDAGSLRLRTRLILNKWLRSGCVEQIFGRYKPDADAGGTLGEPDVQHRRRQIFKQNQEIKTSEDVRMPKTRLMKLGRFKLEPLPEPRQKQPKVSIGQWSIADALLVLGPMKGSGAVCALNSASGEQAGGGVSEAELCRRVPDLYSSLRNAQVLRKEPQPSEFDAIMPSAVAERDEDSLYPFGPASGDRDNYSDVLLTTNLTVKPESKPENKPEVKVSVVSAAAPDMLYSKEVYDSSGMAETVRAIFVAPRMECDIVNTLILGAWGCDVGCPPIDIVNLFSQAIRDKDQGGLYEEIHFAIPEGDNYNIFLQALLRIPLAIEDLKLIHDQREAQKKKAKEEGQPQEQVPQPPAGRTDLLISGRFNSDDKIKYMKAVKEQLEAEGVPVFMVETWGAGDEFGSQTAMGLYRSKAIVAFCSSDYGEKTGAQYETFIELRYAHQHKLHIIPVQLHDTYPPLPRDDNGRAQNSLVLRTDIIKIKDVGMQDPLGVARKIAEAWNNLPQPQGAPWPPTQQPQQPTPAHEADTAPAESDHTQQPPPHQTSLPVPHQEPQPRTTHDSDPPPDAQPASHPATDNPPGAAATSELTGVALNDS